MMHLGDHTYHSQRADWITRKLKSLLFYAVMLAALFFMLYLIGHYGIMPSIMGANPF